ncbi:MAG: hypothetical protein JRI55_04880, partial [Deltaproteobacteria bacterium]|nr:hypothetical protein [Deltaproteobacteria bacterium]
LEHRPEAEQEHWSSRFHFAVDNGYEVPVIGDVLSMNMGEWHFVIDRHQLIREGWSPSSFTGAGFTSMLENTRFWPIYYNYWYGLDHKHEQEETSGDVFVHRVADAVDITAGEPFTWTFPDAETMAAYDRLEADMIVGCAGSGHPYRSKCGEWDTVGGIFLCEDELCEGAQRRIIKWITPYSSPGRWVIDITPELVHLADGGDLTFVAAHGDNNVGAYTYKYTVDMRFSHADDGLRPFAIEELVPRGNYGFAGMTDAFEPWQVVAPEGTVKAELYARISGHGMAENNCAEFCTFEHLFEVNGTPFMHEYLMENYLRCAEWVSLGVTPNGGGNWQPDRSSWCPGWVIEEWREDLTAAFDLEGGINVVDHTATQELGPPPGGNMDARVEIVFYQ